MKLLFAPVKLYHIDVEKFLIDQLTNFQFLHCFSLEILATFSAPGI